MSALAQLDGASTLMAVLLVMSGALLWLSRWSAVVCVAAAGIAGVADGLVTWQGLPALGVFALGCSAYAGGRSGVAGWLLWGALVVASALLFLHATPGIVGLRLLGPVEIGQGAAYEKWISLDKTGAGVLLLALALPTLYGRGGWRSMLRRAGPVMLVTSLGVLGLAAVVGAIGWDVTPEMFLPWAVLNLLTVCLPEEALFRGLIQGRLTRAAAARGWSPHGAIFLAAAVFGTAHFAGGPMLVAASTAAGLGYGYAFWVSGRIEAAILCHFALNAAHFLLFTYPYPAA